MATGGRSSGLAEEIHPGERAGYYSPATSPLHFELERIVNPG